MKLQYLLQLFDPKYTFGEAYTLVLMRHLCGEIKRRLSIAALAEQLWIVQESCHMSDFNIISASNARTLLLL